MRTGKTIGLIGTGVFICLTIQGLSFLFSKIIEEALLFTSLKPLWVYGLSEYVTLILVLLSFVFIIKKIKALDFDKPRTVKKVFLASVLAYVLTQLLGFAQPFVSSIYITEEYYNLKEVYLNGLNESFVWREFSIDTPVWVFKYAVIAILVYRYINRFTSALQET